MKKLFSFLILGVSSIALSTSVYADPPMQPFYAAVIKMSPEGKLGQVIKQEKIATSLKGAQAWRIAYISSDIAGRKTISTGLVIAPLGPAPAGGRPVMTWAHGTTGSAQNCGPSQVIDPAVPLNEYFLVGGNSWTDYGIPAVEEFLKEGYVLVATDYQGLGGGGRHQYSVAATNAMDTINAARAVTSMKETGANKKTIVYGWSQGGGAVIALAGMPEYIQQTGTVSDNPDIVGFVALAPQDISILAPAGKLDQATADKYFQDSQKMFLDSVFNFTHATMFYWGTQAAFPNLKLSDIFTDEGVKVANEIYSNKCMHTASDTFNFNYGSSYASLLKQKPTNTVAWAQAMLKGGVPVVKPMAPVQIYFGSKDTAVPPMMHKLYQEQACKLGGNVGRMQLPGEQSHFTTPGSSKPFYLSWVKDRIVGKSLANACP
ncbi:acetylxylan esterase [Polynucleobacter sp. 15G-AUS-farblos]|uniref:alpha/beta fold hydrolase n=1 Tax=Polynucleobacter sp. 15G-AUS-farblos TaxID=2689094 RepID=UPI001C0CCF71|nr:alpha/beta fold hydrolase [Polynucleobacter sp. 15G-AUS-farblos]MBU3582996.1 acetylxylan esterase [Polynucleobacter sp. 15G-AUS-farblos]